MYSFILIDNGSKDTVVYDEIKHYIHNHTNHFNLIRKVQEQSSINPTVMTANAK